MNDELAGSATAAWRKSSFSGPNGGDCVEVAGLGEVSAVRDSKNTEGPVLRFGAGAWRAFLDGQRD